MNFSSPDINTISLFYPFFSTRKLEDLLMGMFSFKERWEFVNDNPAGEVYPLQTPYSNIHITDISDFVKQNTAVVTADFSLKVNGRDSSLIEATNNIINPGNVFIESGVIMNYCTINADEGPVYIGKNSLVMEGALLRGPVFIGENSVIKMGAKIYGGTSIGNNCIVGGEIKNSIISHNSNKAHDGYLGDSIIGEWCNIGAGTSCSNIKNTAGVIELKLRSVTVSAGNKFGMLMGDYSRCAINTSFNTGTVVGVCCNIFGNAYPPKFIDDFNWGDDRYSLEKALQHIDNWMKFKNQRITAEQKNILTQIYNQTV